MTDTCRGWSQDSSYGYETIDEEAEGPTLWWGKEQASGWSEDDATEVVRFFDRRKCIGRRKICEPVDADAAVNKEYVEITLDKTTNKVTCTVDGRVHPITDTVNLCWDSTTRGPVLRLQSARTSVHLPRQPEHLTFILPDLCAMFNKARLRHNIGRWNSLGEIPEESEVDVRSREPQAVCNCALM
eukprot:TRINITY_DN39436_c0_g1_i1.p1 TRINITY_DN39436_c0_g1~~TRINITY_DN39436_c0_g1_i1.p1  ORF type:complete len:185 (+),score=32.37 TRINITY_DN39436_c0_g1_i1:1-555(+)